MADDPFDSLFSEAGSISPSQLAYINSTPFLHDTALPSPAPSPPPPAVENPTLNCALAQAQTEPELEPEPDPDPIEGLGFDEQAPPPPPPETVGVVDGDVVEVPEPKIRSGRKRAPAPNPKPAPAVDPLLQAVSLMAGKLDPNLENKDILEICAMKGIFFAPPRWHRPGGYEKKKDLKEH